MTSPTPSPNPFAKFLKDRALITAGAGRGVLNLLKGISYDMPKAVANESVEAFKKNPNEYMSTLLLGPAGVVANSPTARSIASFGVEPALQHGLDVTKKDPRPVSTTDVLVGGAKVGWEASKEFFGVNTLKKAWNTEDPMLRGELYLQGGLQALPIVGAASKLLTGFRAGNLLADLGRSKQLASSNKMFRSVDMANPEAYIAAKNKWTHQDALIEKGLPESAQALDGPGPNFNNLPRAVDPQDLMSQYEVAQISNEVIQQLPYKILGSSEDLTKTVAEGLRQGAVSPERLSYVLGKVGADPNTAATAVADAIVRNSSRAGKELSIFSDLQAMREMRLLQGIRMKDPEALRAWRAASNSAAGESMSFWKDLKNMDAKNLTKDVWVGFKKYEQWRKGTGTSGPPTSGRNIATQSLNYISTQFESFLEGSMERMGLFGKPHDAHVSALESMIEFSRTGASLNTTAAGGRVVKDLLATLPHLEDMIQYGSTSMETRATRSVLGPITGAADVVDNVVNVMQYVNFWQEKVFGNAFFGARVSKNLERHGYTMADAQALMEKPPELLTIADRAKLFEIKYSMAEAYHFQAKNTFRDLPVSDSMQKTLKFFQNPIMTALGHPFPRFLANKLAWLNRHNPMHLADLIDPKFRDMLSSSDPLAQQAARDAMSQAASGMFMLAAAKTFRESAVAGHKYYEVFDLVPDKNSGVRVDRTKITDVRSMDPFAAMLGAVDLIKSAVNGTPTNLDSNELIDLWAGIRRMNDLGFVGITTLLQSIANADKETRWRGAARVAGGHLSMWTVPINTIKRLWWDLDLASKKAYEAIEPAEKSSIPLDPITQALARSRGYIKDITESTLGKDPNTIWDYRDTTEYNRPIDVLTAPLNQALGPIGANLYNKTTGEHIEGSPARINQWTGEPDRTFSPIGTQFGGLPQRRTTPLVNAMNSIGLDEREMRKNYKTSGANNLFAAEFNTILKAPLEDGTVFEDKIAQVINTIVANNPEAKKGGDLRNIAQTVVIHGILNSVVQTAEQAAFAKNPSVFIVGKVNNMPIPPDMKSFLRQKAIDLDKLRRYTEGQK